VSIFLTAAKRGLILWMLMGFTSLAFAIPKGAAQLREYEQKYVNRTLDTQKIHVLQNYQAQEFSPEAGEVFEVKSYWVPAASLVVFESSIGDNDPVLELRRTKNGERQVLFLVHPESESFYSDFVKHAERGPRFVGTATASSRTLMMWQADRPENVFFGKLSLNKEIGGVVRTIPKGEVARSVGVSQILDAARGELPKNFDYLPEFFGAMPVGMDRGGMILRALRRNMSSGRTKIIPLFAIYTKPNSKTPSPLEIMLQKSKLSPRDLVVQKILQPFAEQWVDLAVNHGITIEAHAQNVLMELNKSGLPTGKFIYRDFGGFNINLMFRKLRNLAMPKNLPVIEGLEKDYHQEFHQKALQQSLSNYFEGGFLFGLGDEFKRLGHSELDYKNLITIFRQEIQNEFAKKGIAVNLSDFLPSLVKGVEEARKKVPARQLQCPMLFQGALIGPTGLSRKILSAAA
jgi:hypothetical protein